MRKNILAIIFCVLVAFVIAGCAPQWPPFVPGGSGGTGSLTELSDEEIVKTINTKGLVQDILSGEKISGLDVVWSDIDPASAGSRAKALSLIQKNGETLSKLYATVTLGNEYSGRGINGDGISISGTMIFTFNCTVAESDVKTASIISYSAVSASELTITQSDGYMSNTYTVSNVSGMEGNAVATATYTGSGELNVTISKPAAEETITASTAISATVGENEVVISTIWDGSSYSTAWYDTDTEAPSYEIGSAEELAGLALLVNEGKEDFSGKTLTLKADIDLGNHDWEPIGYGRTDNKDPYSYKDDTFNGFAGSFDGGNHTISNLYMNKDSAPNTWERSYVALFGCVKAGSSIKNLIIENVEIHANSFIGSVVGYIPSSSGERGTVTLEGLTASGNVEMSGQFSIGGILGRNETGTDLVMNDCHVSANAGSSITGEAYGAVSNFLGGISGSNYSSNSNAVNDVSVSNMRIVGDTEGVGSIMGHFNVGTISNVSVENVHLEVTGPCSDGDAKSIGAITGLVGAYANDKDKHLLTISGENSFDNVYMVFSIQKFTPFCRGLVGTYRADGIENVDPATNSSVDIVGGVATYPGIICEFAE